MKRIVLLLTATILYLLTACSNQNKVCGKVVETKTDESTGLVSFIMHTDNDKEVVILLNDETHIFTFVEGINNDEFKSGSFTDVIVSVEYEKPQRTLTTTNNQQVTTYTAKQIEITGFLAAKTTSVSDGTSIAIWNYYDRSSFTLPNEIELLQVPCRTGPNNVYVGGVESFDDLSEEAQKNVMEFYSEQGLLYDVQSVLEQAYDDYAQQEDATKFSSYMISQDIAPTASNEVVMYFLTSVYLPIDSNHSYEYRIGTAFDKKTGGYISNWNLFSCSPEEAVQTILDIAGISDLSLRKEMESAFIPENIVFFPDNLEVCFQQGTLPSQEHTYMLGLDYDDRLAQIIYPWAIPKTMDN